MMSDTLFLKMIRDHHLGDAERKRKQDYFQKSVDDALNAIQEFPVLTSPCLIPMRIRNYDNDRNDIQSKCIKNLNTLLDDLFHDSPFLFRYFGIHYIGNDYEADKWANPLGTRISDNHFGYPGIVCIANPKFSDGQQEFQEMIRVIPSFLGHHPHFEIQIFNNIAKEYIIV
jgi:hypothetical protein